MKFRAVLVGLGLFPAPPILCLGCGTPLGEHSREEMEACKKAVHKMWGSR